MAKKRRVKSSPNARPKTVYASKTLSNTRSASGKKMVTSRSTADKCCGG